MICKAHAIFASFSKMHEASEAVAGGEAMTPEQLNEAHSESCASVFHATRMFVSP
jgi:hypothetical protein